MKSEDIKERLIGEEEKRRRWKYKTKDLQRYEKSEITKVRKVKSRKLFTRDFYFLVIH